MALVAGGAAGVSSVGRGQGLAYARSIHFQLAQQQIHHWPKLWPSVKFFVVHL